MPNRAIVFDGPGEVSIEERERPDPEAEEVLVETRSSLVSTGTELTILSGEFPENSAWADYGQYPFVAGYCNVGEVVGVGSDVSEIEPGELVASRSPHQAYVTAAAADCTVVPERIPANEAAFFALAAITMNGVRQGEVRWGETVAVYGLGLLGQLATRWCRLAGATVVACEISPERFDFLPKDRRRIATANPDSADVAGVVREHNRGRLADVVFEVTGVPDVLESAFSPLRQQGRLVVLSSPRGETSLDFHDYCNGPGYEIVGAHERTHPPESTYRDPWSARRHRELFFDLLAAGEVDVGSLISHRVDPGEAPAVYESLLADRSDAMGVVLEW